MGYAPPRRAATGTTWPDAVPWIRVAHSLMTG